MEREGQLNMSLDIAEAIENGKNIMVEAGVGIGKSYGYLFPALIASIYSRRPVLIATSSIQLSEQLAGDAHRAASYLGMKVKVAVGKGRPNYACLDRVIKAIKHTKKDTKLKRWLLEHADGDRGKIPFLVDDSEWEEVQVDQCKFEDCDYRHECEFYKMRNEIREGGSADVIIVNQDLLVAHLLKREQTFRGLIANRLPVIIIDEAHNLEEKTRKALTRMWSPNKIKDLFNRINKLLQSKENYFELLPHIGFIQNMINHMFLEWAADMENQIKDQDRYHYSDRLKVIVPSNLASVAYKKAFYDLLISLNTIDGKRERDAEEVAGELENLNLFFDDLKEADYANQIYWGSANIEKGIDSIHIYHAPKDINKKLERLLFRNLDYRVPVVLTSATLCQHAESIDKQYKYQAEALGYSGLYSEPKTSPFAYEENARIYIPDDIIPPTKERHEMYLKQISNRILELALATNGRTMVLFTSKEDLQYVYQKLSDKKLPWPILTPRKGSSQSKVIEEFKTSNGLLLGTGVFWEGINISGQDLSQVIIPRLPFPVPDPIISFKCSLTQNPTNDVLIPEMLVKLRQGVGRLIRSETDKGIVSILDSRISSHPKKRRDYRDDVLHILPIKTQLHSVDEVREFAKTFNRNPISLLQSG